MDGDQRWNLDSEIGATGFPITEELIGRVRFLPIAHAVVIVAESGRL